MKYEKLKFDDLVGGLWYWEKCGEVWVCWYFDDDSPGCAGMAYEQTICKDQKEFYEDAEFFGPIIPPSL